MNTLKDVSTQTPNENAYDENFIRQHGSNESVTLNEVVTFDAGEFDDEVFQDEIVVVDTVGGEESGTNAGGDGDQVTGVVAGDAPDAQSETSPYAGGDGSQVTAIVAEDTSPAKPETSPNAGGDGGQVTAIVAGDTSAAKPETSPLADGD